MSTRNYELRRRAESQAETRRRIVAAVLALHRDVGPARTTIAAIAERAGVERLTVYRHFADEGELFAACSALFRAEVPPPDPSAWSAVRGASRRLAAALLVFYEYYERGEPVIANVARDAAQLPALREFVERRQVFMHTVRDELASAWNVRGARRDRLRAAIGHALAFDTWRSLVREQGLSARNAAELMVRFANAAVRAGSKRWP
jgi:AcrR family transcriptional regulator